jgi:hypothetical protein
MGLNNVQLIWNMKVYQVRLEVLRAVGMKMAVFWVVASIIRAMR